MRNNTTTDRTLGRRGALGAIGAIAGLGAVAVLGGATALAQQGSGMSGMPGTGGMDQSGMMGGQSPGGMSGMMAGMQRMMGMMGGMTGPDADRMFIQEMIPHHQSAVAMATVGWQQAEHPEIKQIAEVIVKSQNEEIEQMARLYQALFNAPVPGGQMSMMMDQTGMTADALKGAKPADKAFIEMMSMHHQMAIMMASMALPAAKNDELAKLQQTIIVDQAKEIGQMRDLRRAWYPA